MKNFNVAKPINTRPLLLGALLTVGLAAAAGAAAGAADVPQVVVRYGDLNLRSDQGVQTLYRRITAAAKAVCPAPETGRLDLLTVAERCRAEAIARAIHDVDNPQLAALQQRHAKSG